MCSARISAGDDGGSPWSMEHSQLVHFTPDFFPSAQALCSSMPLLSSGSDCYYCKLKAISVLTAISYMPESDGASLPCPLEPSRHPHPCRQPSVARSLVHYGRGFAAAFRPRGLLRTHTPAVAGEGEGCRMGEAAVYARVRTVRQTGQASVQVPASGCSVPNSPSTRLEA
jgi:hypothetical protein